MTRAHLGIDSVGPKAGIPGIPGIPFPQLAPLWQA
jgi:hypothetical protein